MVKFLMSFSALATSLVLPVVAGAVPVQPVTLPYAQAKQTAHLTTEELNLNSLEHAQQSNVAPVLTLPASASHSVIAAGTGLDTPPVAVTPALPEHFYNH